MSNNIANSDTPILPYYVAMFHGRSVAIKRDADYQNTIKLVQKSIPKLRSADLQDIFISTALADYGGALVQISEEIWSDIVGEVRTVEITLDDPMDAGHPASGRVSSGDENVDSVRPDERVTTVATAATPETEHSRAAPPQPVHDPTNTFTNPSDTFSILVRTVSQDLLKLDNLRPSSTIRNVQSIIETTYRVPAVLQRLDLLGQPLDDTKTLEQCKIANWTILDLHLNARQSMIYFYPDLTIVTSERFRLEGVKVKLSLNRAWELAALQPSREAPPQDYAQTMSWTVDVAEGVLLDHASNTELTRLFWDGISRPIRPVAPDSPLPQSHPEPHSPHSGSNLVPLLDPTNSAAFPFNEVEGYLQSVFYQMGFTGPSSSPRHLFAHLKQKSHEYLALRFISQDDCDTISSLSISPPTEHITRVLVLYKGLSAVAAEVWNGTQEKPTLNSVVNAKPRGYWHGQPGFKVLEIAWMEAC